MLVGNGECYVLSVAARAWLRPTSSVMLNCLLHDWRASHKGSATSLFGPALGETGT